MYANIKIICSNNQLDEILFLTKKFINKMNNNTQYMVIINPYWKDESCAEIDVYFPVVIINKDELKRNFMLFTKSESEDIYYNETNNDIEMTTYGTSLDTINNRIFSVLYINKKNCSILFDISNNC